MSDEDVLYGTVAQDFCVTCRTTILSEDPLLQPHEPYCPGKSPTTHHESFATFHAATEEGCFICTRLEKSAWDEIEHIDSLPAWWDSETPFISYHMWQHSQPGTHTVVIVTFYVLLNECKFILYCSKGNAPSQTKRFILPLWLYFNGAIQITLLLICYAWKRPLSRPALLFVPGTRVVRRRILVVRDVAWMIGLQLGCST